MFNIALELRGLTLTIQQLTGAYTHSYRTVNQQTDFFKKNKKNWDKLLFNECYEINSWYIKIPWFCCTFGNASFYMWLFWWHQLINPCNHFVLLNYKGNYKGKHGFVIHLPIDLPKTDTMMRSLVNWELLKDQMWGLSCKLWCNGQI